MLNKQEQAQVKMLLNSKYNKKISTLLTEQEAERVHSLFKYMVFLPVVVAIVTTTLSWIDNIWIKSLLPFSLLFIFVFVIRYIKKLSDYHYFNQVIEDPTLAFNLNGEDFSLRIKQDIKQHIERHRALKTEL